MAGILAVQIGLVTTHNAPPKLTRRNSMLILYVYLRSLLGFAWSLFLRYLLRNWLELHLSKFSHHHLLQSLALFLVNSHPSNSSSIISIRFLFGGNLIFSSSLARGTSNLTDELLLVSVLYWILLCIEETHIIHQILSNLEDVLINTWHIKNHVVATRWCLCLIVLRSRCLRLMSLRDSSFSAMVSFKLLLFYRQRLSFLNL